MPNLLTFARPLSMVGDLPTQKFVALSDREVDIYRGCEIDLVGTR
jgi:hypothetical protein